MLGMGQALSREYDVIVLGLGALGSAAAYWSAKRGARVLGLEQFEFGHARGSSHDRSRIIRLSYFTPAYVQMAKEAYRAWASLEEDAGERNPAKRQGKDSDDQRRDAKFVPGMGLRGLDDRVLVARLHF